MTKKYIIILFVIFILLIVYINNRQKEITITAFNETYKDYDFDNYYIFFDECIFNTDNFIEKLSYFENKDYKILEIIPYIKESYKYLFNNKEFLFYSNNNYQVLNEFKNKYLNIIEDSNYISNICIKSIRINTAYIYYKEFKSDL